jgi:hypothetical protein
MFLKKSSHALPQRPPVDSKQIGNNSSPLASHAALYLVFYTVPAITAARPGLRAAESDKGTDAATGVGHVVADVIHTSATTTTTTGLLKSGAL